MPRIATVVVGLLLLALRTLDAQPDAPRVRLIEDLRLDATAEDFPRVAQVYVALGDQTRALDWLERGVGTDPYLVYLGIDPTFRPLHAEPRFRVLLKKVGLDE